MNTIRTIPTHGRFVFHVQDANFMGDGPVEYAAAAYDGMVMAFDCRDEQLWEVATSGFPFDVFAYDIDNNGRDEILVASADQHAYAISADGRILWRFKTGGPLLQITAGKLDGVNPVIIAAGVDHGIYVLSPAGRLLRRIPSPMIAYHQGHGFSESARGRGAVRLLRCGDIFGDGKDRVIGHAKVKYDHGVIFCLDGEGLEWRWEVSPYPVRVVDGPRGCCTPASLLVADIDGNGVCEIVGGSKSSGGEPPDDVFVVDGHGKVTMARRNAEKMNRNDYNYRMVRLASGTTGRYPIMAQSGPRLMLFDSELRPMGEATAPISFTGITGVQRAGDERNRDVILAVHGDGMLVRCSLEKGWEDEFRSLSRQGVGLRIREKCLRDAQAVSRMPAAANERHKDEPYIIEIAAVFMTKARLKDVEHYIRHYRWVKEQFPYNNLRLATVFWLGEKGCGLSPAGRKWQPERRVDYAFTAEELVALAGSLEDEGMPFLIQNSHGTGGTMKLATIEKVMQRAPRNFLGLVGSETHHDTNDLETFANEYLVPEMELCRTYNRKMILRESAAFWMKVITEPRLFELFFNGKYKDVLVPCAEEATGLNMDLCVAARVGLWATGLVNTWGTRVIGDQLRLNNLFIWDSIMAGHPFLRILIAHAAMGASLFMLHHGMDNASGESSFCPTEKKLYWTGVGEESTVMFLHLLGKGLLLPPERNNIAGLSGTALSLERISERLEDEIADWLNYGGYTKAQSEKHYVISKFRLYWAMANAFTSDFAYVAYGKYRYYGRHIPVSKYGYPPLVSELMIRKASENFSRRIVTDGDIYRLDNKEYSADDGREKVIQRLEAGAEGLMFRTDDHVFLQFMKTGSSAYRLYLVDPELLEPRQRKITVSILPDNHFHVVDVLDGRRIEVANDSFEVVIPAGYFRILEATAMGDRQ